MKGFLVHQAVPRQQVSTVRIHWGIIKYLHGASYEQDVQNEALMLIFFGQDTLPNGHVVIPALPYFIGLFLGQEEQLYTPTGADIFTRAAGLCRSAIPAV